MKNASTHRRVTAAVGRDLARRDRELFGKRRGTVSRNDQYFHLWQRILVGLVAAIHGRHRGADVDRLDRLAQELERAQERGRLPTSLVRKIVPRGRHGTVRPA